MALPHAQALDIIDVRPLGSGLDDAVTSSLIKTPALQLMPSYCGPVSRCPSTAWRAR